MYRQFRCLAPVSSVDCSTVAKKTSPAKEESRGLLSRIGPGFITGASDDDPSGIGTYAQIGAAFGYAHLWMTLFSIPFMIAVQEMCGRIGLVTGRGLAGVLRKHYARPVLVGAVSLLVLANVINIGADMVAMAAALRLVLKLPYAVWLTILMIGSLALIIFVPYAQYVRYLKYLTLTLFAYVAVALVVRQDWSAIAHATLLPTISFDTASIMTAVAFLGTTVSPYLFFWQSAEEVEEQVAHHRIRAMGVGVPRVTPRDIRDMRLDTTVGMIFSNLISYFIIITTASTLHRHGVTHIDSAAEAARALQPVAGPFASLLFALGIVGTGLIAIPVLAGSASYAVSEMLGWKEGLSLSFRQAKGFYRIIILATIGGLCVTLTGIQPFQLLYYAAIFNGIAAPPLLLLIVLICNNDKVMRGRTNGPASNILGIGICLLMSACAGYLLWSLLTGAS